MLQSMGSQSVRHDLATEQQPSLWVALHSSLCYVIKDYKSLLPHDKLALHLGLYVSNYLLQLPNLSWAQTKPVACSSIILLLLFFNLV